MADQEKIMQTCPIIQRHANVQIVKKNDGTLTHEVIEHPLTANEERAFQIIHDRLVEYPIVNENVAKGEKGFSKLKKYISKKRGRET